MDRGLATIKAVVIGMGLLIVAITVVIVIVIVDRATDTVTAEPDAPETGAIAPVEPVAYADVAVALPAGARAVTMTGEGDVLSLLVQAAGGAQSIVTIDRRSGEVLGTLELLPRGVGE